MHFQVLNIVTKQFVGLIEGPTRWPTGEMAAVAAVSLTTETGQKHQPRPIVDGAEWRERERERMEDGTYLPVPWTYQPWFRAHYNSEHFLHLSTEKGGYVAFTEDEQKGAADRQTRMRAGAYLKRFFGGALSDDVIARLATELAAETESNEVLFADTEDEIERVYLDGPDSCMSHDAEDYESSIHPVRVYAAGDLAVAYLERDDASHFDKRITARSVVWPAKKIFTRIYGDEARLKPLLKALGYKNGDLEGARLLKIEEKGGWVAPYVDATDNFDVGTTHLILRSGGRYSCSDAEPTGICPPDGDRITCDRCDDRVDEDETCSVNTSRRFEATWCRRCEERHAIYCSDEGISVPEDDAVSMADGGYWSEWKFQNDGGICDSNDKNYPADDLCEVITLNGTKNWCKDERDSYATKCDVTGNWYADDATVDLPDGRTVGFDTDEANAAEAAADEPLPRKPSPTIHHPDQLEMPITTWTPAFAAR
jgi:hypothetical protein